MVRMLVILKRRVAGIKPLDAGVNIDSQLREPDNTRMIFILRGTYFCQFTQRTPRSVWMHRAGPVKDATAYWQHKSPRLRGQRTLLKQDSQQANRWGGESRWGPAGTAHGVRVPKQTEQSRLLLPFVSRMGCARSQRGKGGEAVTETARAKRERSDVAVFKQGFWISAVVNWGFVWEYAHSTHGWHHIGLGALRRSVVNIPSSLRNNICKRPIHVLQANRMQRYCWMQFFSICQILPVYVQKPTLCTFNLHLPRCFLQCHCHLLVEEIWQTIGRNMCVHVI